MKKKGTLVNNPLRQVDTSKRRQTEEEAAKAALAALLSQRGGEGSGQEESADEGSVGSAGVSGGRASKRVDSMRFFRCVCVRVWRSSLITL